MVSIKRNLNLDLLKILACIAVICLHTTAPIFEKLDGYTITHAIYYSSTFAIPVFFMVNGALILNKESITIQYLFNKIINILSLVLVFNVINWYINSLLNRYIENPIQLSINSLMQRGYFFQFWFLLALCIVYIFCPILHYIFNKDKRYIVMITIIFVLLIIGIDFANMYSGKFSGKLIINHIPQAFRIWTWIGYFWLGGVIIKYRNYIYEKVSIKSNLLFFIILSFLSLIYQYKMTQVINSIYAENFYDNILILLWIITLFTLIERIKIKSCFNNIIIYISQYVMGIFIVHLYVINSINALNYYNSFINILMTIVVFIISLIVSKTIKNIPYMDKILKI